ncbi:hypothetical protein AX15_003060 [Amanita polypyramis BW_CC]|nr:hypothetical protein AX15_003060 [Amanita polypyramis BW_CC]
MPVTGTMTSAATVTAVAGIDSSKAQYYSTTFTSIIACLVPLVALLYLAVFSWFCHRVRQNPKALNKASGRLIQRCAPAAYMYLVCVSLIEIAFASWLLLQYRFNHNYPRVETRTGAAVLVFTACWTTITAGAYTFLFVHPTWSTHPITSVGAQAIWVFVTWLLWIISSGMINASVPSALVKARCTGVVYCHQIQLMFAFSVVQTMSLTAALGVLAWMVWQSTRGVSEETPQEETTAEWS